MIPRPRQAAALVLILAAWLLLMVRISENKWEHKKVTVINGIPGEHRKPPDESENLTALAAEQARRADRVRALCGEMAAGRVGVRRGQQVTDPASGKSHLAWGNEVWVARDPRYSQTLRLSSHLLWPPRRLAYCWIHKVHCSSVYSSPHSCLQVASTA